MRFEHSIRTKAGQEERRRYLRQLAVWSMYYSDRGRARVAAATSPPKTVHDQAAAFVHSFCNSLGSQAPEG